ncbi:hypothetical protein R6L23_00965 [Streptomyces sp. SR27]|uniref:hypothetical protein n=1 Tax=Streptomyces sp. SR27 TaxID=3076630 RepID=UPI00295BE8AC|nr:hypothetical protein [Streptomyces sp. SR27]MDV9186819.1 hypothetical protein [Streptomyces sp. SR27]
MKSSNDSFPEHGRGPKRVLNRIAARRAARLRKLSPSGELNVQQNKLTRAWSSIAARVRGLLPSRGRSVQRALMEGVAYKLGSGAVSAILLWYINR